ncbi:predicted protein [Nematostella vectensis]|uniref:Uncharacterized protein n=1 Tax=Nematostella vectensis TaxID=45351 RepID=A7RLR4_NEMVE|nr:intraflagellar transport-associated protein [Nematostella vectensis]EDO47737.1 predicted protein [Nematostella vectensis]|eukprot:XP_001639800.1 predicted protein [Nematostella vectensis]
MAVGTGEKDDNKQTSTQTNGTSVPSGLPATGTDLNQYVVEFLDQIFKNAEQHCVNFDTVEGEGTSQGFSLQAVSGSQTSSLHQQSTGSQSLPPHSNNPGTDAGTASNNDDDTDWDTNPGEEIGPGTKTEPFLMRSLSSGSDGKMAKLDNFVDDEGDISDDDESSWSDSTLIELPGLQSSSDIHPAGNSKPDRDIQMSLRSPHQDIQQDSVDNLPGEVVEESNIERASLSLEPTVRKLGITTTSKPVTENTSSLGHSVEQNASDSCDVQPFELDKDFDYDVVALTPKFDFL